jgi:hypothetical protein
VTPAKRLLRPTMSKNDQWPIDRSGRPVKACVSIRTEGVFCYCAV